MTTATYSQKTTPKKIKLDRYAGKWVAFLKGKIINWADTLEELEKKVKKLKAEKEAVYFLVPRKDEGPYVLFVLSLK
ncbi:hypothetical protein KJ636_05510 [Patescibacteria group bacterium]|nr:hypothetical protein [Patescibacteria group bacterium]MBU4481182.1 hypothetical protein [Patescibacteria group bacterium]